MTRTPGDALIRDVIVTSHVHPYEMTQNCSEKAKAARTFKRWRDVVTHDPKYISMRKMWREYENHNIQELQ